jgi:carbonic anhydrase
VGSRQYNSPLPVLTQLFDNNRAWAARVSAAQPDFFRKLAAQQAPEYLWIGCSDSRVPANEIVGLLPGELFVHRNVANLVVHTDLNCLSVLQFAVDVLRVGHVIVCGHYGCGGVVAALKAGRLGLIDNWLRHVKTVRQQHAAALDATPAGQQADRLCELNVIEQVRHVAETTVIQDAWARGQRVAIHGWIYDIADGLLRDLEVSVDANDGLADAHQKAVLAVTGRALP